MKYYCNICRKDITKAEFLYSVDKFDRPLCREHQQMERAIQEPPYESPSQPLEPEPEIEEETPIEETKSGWKSALKRVAIATGKGIVKGTRKIVDASRKSMQIRRWKDDILRRMSISQMKRLCFERRVSTKKSELKESRSGDLYWKEYNCSKGDLVARLKNKVSLDDIISFAKRNHINIRDILRDIDLKKSEWMIKEITEDIKETGTTLLKELEKAVREFKPLRKYDREIFYQDSLASWLKSKFADTEIEIPRGTARPDIVVEGVAIEIKGPTYERDLVTLIDKCGRYRKYFPQGLLIVLFDVYVNEFSYKDRINAIKDIFPDVIVIRK